MVDAVVYADTIWCLGSSVKRGLDSLLTDLPAADYDRVFGIPLSVHVAAGYPATATVPGVKMWTCRQPYATWNSRTITAGDTSGGTNLDYSGGDVSAQHPKNSWLFIQVATNGQGSLKRIDTHTGTDVQIFGTWGGAGLSNTGTVIFLKNSHTVNGTVTNSLTVTKETDTGVFGAVEGKFVQFFSGVLRKVVTAAGTGTGTHVLTLDDAVTVADEVGFCILDGADSGGTLAGMATGAVLQDMQIHFNNAPVLFTGLDYSNYDQQCVVSAPTFTTATINSDIEMFWQFRSRFGDTLYGLDINRDSATISPEPIGTLLRTLLAGWQHDLTDLSFHPSTTGSLWQAFETATESMQALIEAEGKTMRVRAFVALIAENDQILTEGGEVRHASIGRNLALLFTAVRELAGDPKLPCIAIGPASTLYTFGDEVYAQLEQLVMEDTYAESVDTRDTDRYTFTSDGRHFMATSQTNLGVDTALAYDRVVAGSTLDDVGICNLALSHIGESARITSLNTTIDTSAQARHCARFYLPALHHLLELHSWDFATRRIDAVAVTNTREDEWVYAYEAPRGMAGAIAVLPPGAANDAPSLPFIKEVDASGRTVIYTDVEDAVIRFNRYVTNTRRFSASFARALSWLIASDLAGPIIKGAEGSRKAAECLAMMRTFFGQAATHDSNQRQVEVPYEAPWMT